jgi:hypothetical protein
MEKLTSEQMRDATQKGQGVFRNAQNKGYGEGECRYYFNEYEKDLLETEWRKEAKEMRRLAENTFSRLFSVEDLVY